MLLLSLPPKRYVHRTFYSPGHRERNTRSVGLGRFPRRQLLDQRRLEQIGDAPALLAKAKGKKGDKGVQMLSLHPRQGPGINMTLDTKLLHIFSRLLRQAVAKTDWEMNLGLHGGKEAAEPEQKAVPRKLN